MTEIAEYRFLPWTRRGLVAEIGDVDSPTASLPERAAVKVGITVSGQTPSQIDLTIYGPGDVLGIDPALVVRTDPRPNSTDVEPNYLPVIEFDPPDFPWMFTPARAGSNDRLRPWLVLVCVDRTLVDPPHVRVTGDARAPLPVIEIRSQQVQSELPDLRESWAWAHVQVASDDSAGLVTPTGLADAPTLNVSRLVCPRRLEPGRQYLACLVPAFDAGVKRGLTGSQPTAAGTASSTLRPAWDVLAPADLVLPVYYHWEFTTGPAGDFEELARKLEPFACPPTVGYEPMDVGHAGPQMPEIASGQPGSTLDMDGALRAPVRGADALSDVDPTIQQGLADALNAAAQHAEGEGADETPVLGPPLYGEGQTGSHRVRRGDIGWFTEANLDPRARVAGGLATEVVQRNQEDLMHSAWEQVGRVRDANDRLSWGRLALEAGRRWHERHLAPLPAGRLAQLAGPLASRVLMQDVTVRETASRTSLPDAATDSALRRLTGGRHRLVRKAAAISPSVDFVEREATVPSTLFTKMASGETVVDPNRFERDGLAGVSALEELDIPAGGAGPVDLSAVGLAMEVSADVLRAGRARFRAASTVHADLTEGMTANRVSVRPDIRSTGLITTDHVRAIAEAPRQGGTLVEQGLVHQLLVDLTTASSSNPTAVAFHIDGSTVRPRVNALDVDTRGNILVRTEATRPSVRIGHVSESVLARGTSGVGDALARLDPGSLPSARRVPSAPTEIDAPGPISLQPGGGPMLRPRPPDLPALEERPLTQTIPAPIRDAAVLTRFESAWGASKTILDAVPRAPVRSVVPFPTDASQSAVLLATDPVQVVPRRLATMLRVREISLFASPDQRLELTDTADRIFAYPEIPIPVYELLAKYDRERFVPGIGILPPNAITLLETNPRFVESFLLGFNHELNRELIWREYPATRQGTPIQHFWAWADGRPDIPPIHTWSRGGALGTTTRGGPGGQLVLLIRGDLLRRFPNTMVYAWRSDQGKLKDPPADGDIVRHVFNGWFEPDVTFFGFPLTEADLADGWFFVIQEQPTEPRFGFDEGADGTIANWSQATWGHTGTQPAGHLRVEGSPLEGVTRNEVTFGRNAAHLAAVTLQRPVRVAVASSEIVSPE